MAEPFIGEINLFGFNFAPVDWAFCNGDIISINQNPSLFSLINTQFGGDGITDFAYPDFRGRVPVSQYPQNPFQFGMGRRGGLESVTLNHSEMADHTHDFMATAEDADKNAPSDGRSLAVATQNIYSSTATSLVSLSPGTSSITGGGQAHPNIQPTQVINFCIALKGIYPPRN